MAHGDVPAALSRTRKAPGPRTHLRGTSALALLAALALAGTAEAAPLTIGYEGYLDFGGVPGVTSPGDRGFGTLTYETSTAPDAPGLFTLPTGTLSMNLDGLSFLAQGLTARIAGVRISFSGSVADDPAHSIYNGVLSFNSAYSTSLSPDRLPATVSEFGYENTAILSYSLAAGGPADQLVWLTIDRQLAMPEPAAAALFACGILGLVLCRAGAGRTGRADTAG